ncbi:N-acetyltransferase [Paramagnetospirillum kuznetsovii]|uniref:N-acetyltransferase n=1 Tax=Paramagnetospirillum kuznetsovii TaxID=2053833 RepID=A0A364P2E4_9PROT|nr:GNAT family N-acetyltransferase [Paramagnetospirillum kuznetsovii]RAU23456.1 N-acetyltransferase [Paramagnetospirillum kuznetsovii]
MADDIIIAAGWRAGAIGDIVALHGRYYAQRWAFGPFFEAKVASDLAEFIKQLHQHPSQLWCAMDSMGRVVGAIAIDGRHGRDQGAHLRWFILDSCCRGLGLGSRLLDTALAFCRDADFARVSLWTFEGLVEARRLYESRGFALAEELSGQTWGKTVTEQRFELIVQAKK